jgi:hypothetical protein
MRTGLDRAVFIKPILPLQAMGHTEPWEVGGTNESSGQNIRGRLSAFCVQSAWWPRADLEHGRAGKVICA